MMIRIAKHCFTGPTGGLVYPAFKPCKRIAFIVVRLSAIRRTARFETCHDTSLQLAFIYNEARLSLRDTPAPRAYAPLVHTARQSHSKPSTLAWMHVCLFIVIHGNHIRCHRLAKPTRSRDADKTIFGVQQFV